MTSQQSANGKSGVQCTIRVSKAITKGKKNSCRRVLNEHAGTPINTTAEALLINRTKRDAQQSYQCRYPRERRSPTGCRPVLNHEIHASNELAREIGTFPESARLNGVASPLLRIYSNDREKHFNDSRSHHRKRRPQLIAERWHRT